MGVSDGDSISLLELYYQYRLSVSIININSTAEDIIEGRKAIQIQSRCKQSIYGHKHRAGLLI